MSTDAPPVNLFLALVAQATADLRTEEECLADEARGMTPCAPPEPQPTPAAPGPNVSIDIFDEAHTRARMRKGTPPDSDPRWALFNQFKDQKTTFSVGPGKYGNAKNNEATFTDIVWGFFHRAIRPDRTEAQFAKALERWRAKGAKKPYKPERARKDGGFVSGGVCKDDSPAPNPCCPKNRKNFVDGNVRHVGRILAYDVDNKKGERTIGKIRQHIIEIEVAAVFYSTHSHTAEK